MSSRDYPLSASQLKSFKRCPRSYEFSYKDDYPETKAPKGYRAMGSAVHEAIENVMRRAPTLRDETMLEDRFQRELDGLDYEYPAEMDEKVDTCISNAAAYIASRTDAEIQGLEVDHEFTVDRPDLTYPFRAIMDVCTTEEIWDWKTGKRREQDEQIQGAVYLAAFMNKFNRPPEAIRFIYLKDREVGSIERTDEHGQEFWSESKEPEGWEQVVSLAKRILRSWEKDEFPAKPSESKCFFCDHEIFCEASKAGVGGEDPLTLLLR